MTPPTNNFRRNILYSAVLSTLIITFLISYVSGCNNHADHAKLTPLERHRLEHLLINQRGSSISSRSNPSNTNSNSLDKNSHLKNNDHGKSRLSRFARPRNTIFRSALANSTNDIFWMKVALATTFEFGGPCPFVPFGAVLVNRETNLMVMKACNTDYIDPTLHGELNVIQLAARYNPLHAKDLNWWQNLTLYTTAEPCSMCMSAIKWAGIGEVVYATSIPTLDSMGWYSIDLSASQVNQAAINLPGTTKLRGEPLAASLTDMYFSWQFNETAKCPAGCSRQVINPGEPLQCMPKPW